MKYGDAAAGATGKWTIINVLTNFLGLKRGSWLLSMQDQKALGFHPKYLNLCSKDE